MYDLQERRLIDAEVTRRSVDFMQRQARAKRPFFTFAALTQPHLPTLPNPAFAGKTGNGDWADMLAEMDHNVGQCSMPWTGCASATTPSAALRSGRPCLQRFRRSVQGEINGQETIGKACERQQRN